MKMQAGKGMGAKAGVTARPQSKMGERRHSQWIIKKYGPVPLSELLDVVGPIPLESIRILERGDDLVVSLREIVRVFGRTVALLLRPGPEWLVKIPHNLVVNEGLDHSLATQFTSTTFTGSGNWWIGLTDGSPSFGTADTMGSAPGWSEITDYDEDRRANLNLGAVSGQSVDNGANNGTFSINASVTVGGAFLVYSLGAGSAPGNTAVGTLYGGGAFSGGDRSLSSGDTLNVEVTLNAGTA